ncbi:hypothetical protein VOLCADRAFT_118405 [Volvox carteri f. nagariensis]|uniref:Adenine DNA glycosylase n=1 Tax=Volvox carteri f. nagariensis TaxID=3068 RepID=D8U4N0_VOLCA|nr:uncharacterized protein VOLCADRAFT_118405 [Volvox carteri f. nagariensis]EFJ45303.1 hypothetical protein VOLCADRAFT_118405 [Volvox carteri f. nagariensis]|eukprot:XP_002953679.1 hypothetical protein VOLCADRAFT_118405 [Volvox carteri f. nagariensis]
MGHGQYSFFSPLLPTLLLLLLLPILLRCGGRNLRHLHLVSWSGCKPQVKTALQDSGNDKELPKSRVGPKTGVAHPSGKPWFTEQEVKEYRRELLAWYDHNHRVLPWRRTPHSKKANAGAAEVVAPEGERGSQAAEAAPADLPQQQFAYWVWVSEVMLQQTQVATVIPYFNRWVTKWPTVADLAAADIDAVNALWAGLGYYRRARYLLDGARYVVEKLDGKFPTTAAELLKIPAVDGNVIRVVSRLRALPGDPTKLAATHAAMASELLDPQRPGCYNQALMELGATVCRPVNPSCAACPVRGVCRAVADWDAYLAAGGDPDKEGAPCVTQYPGRKAVKEKREEAVAVTVLEVICTVQPLAGVAAAGGCGKAPPAATAVATEAGTAGKAPTQPPRKRQRTMQDFALAAAARKQQQQRDGDAVEGTKDRSGAVQQTPVSAAADQERQSETGHQVAAARGGGGGEGAAAGPCDLEALVARGSRHYLLTMRPQGGLLAGLWEFPGVIVQANAAGRGGNGEDGGGGDGDDEADDDDGDDEDDEDEDARGRKQKGHAAAGRRRTPAGATSAERQRASDVLLRRLLGANVSLVGPAAGPGADADAAAPSDRNGAGDGDGAPPPLHTLRVLARHDMAQYVHVFSHIRQTNYIKRVTAVFHGDQATLQRLTGPAVRAGADSEPGRPDGDLDSEDMEVVEVKCPVDPSRGGESRRDPKAAESEGDVEKTPGGSGSTTKAGQGNGKGTSRNQSRGNKAATGMAPRDKQKAAAGLEPGPGGGASIMWASRQQIEGPGLALSSGVKKIFQQAIGGLDGAGGGGGRAVKPGAGKGRRGGVKAGTGGAKAT